jgi:hypothetical protein
MKGFWFRRVAGFICMVIVGVLVFGGIVMLLWNALMPELFHLPIISFWQALGLLLLTKILFSGFRGGGPPSRWKNKMKQKWMNMTPEEREKFKQEWGRRCRPPFGGAPFSPGETSEQSRQPGQPFSPEPTTGKEGSV